MRVVQGHQEKPATDQSSEYARSKRLKAQPSRREEGP
jgi:hypothetical protein